MQSETANWKMSDALTHSHTYTLTYTQKHSLPHRRSLVEASPWAI